jgi:hypothetical protein
MEVRKLEAVENQARSPRESLVAVEEDQIFL